MKNNITFYMCHQLLNTTCNAKLKQNTRHGTIFILPCLVTQIFKVFLRKNLLYIIMIML